MNIKQLISFVILSGVILIKSGSAQSIIYDEVTMSPGNTDMVFYALENGAVSSVVQSSWDLAFAVTPMGSTIRINGGSGCELMLYGGLETWDSVDTSMIGTLPKLYNDQSDWGVGAYSQGGDGVFDIGWGLYNIVTHIVTGDKVFILKLSDGTLKKTKIVSLEAGEFKYVYANIDGSDSQELSVVQSDYTDKNFVYFDFGSEMLMDLEPVNTSWDMVFLKYIADVGGGFYYPVTGCLANNNVSVQKVEGLFDPFYESDFSSELMSDLADAIGYDWKEYDMNLGAYNVADDRCYFVSDENGMTWRVVFTAFEGSATGIIELGKILEEAPLNDVTHLNSTDIQDGFALYPNPTSSGNVSLVINSNSTETITLYNAMGSIASTPLQVNGERTVNLQVNDLSQGVYLVEVRSSEDSYFKQLVIE
jgi:hypothetical protein